MNAVFGSLFFMGIGYSYTKYVSIFPDEILSLSFWLTILFLQLSAYLLYVKETNPDLNFIQKKISMRLLSLALLMFCLVAITIGVKNSNEDPGALNLAFIVTSGLMVISIQFFVRSFQAKYIDPLVKKF